MINYLIIFILFLSTTICSGQQKPGARQIAMAHSGIALSNDVFSIFNNSAGLTQLNWRELGIYYSPAPFNIKELANGFFAYHEPTGIGSFGLGAMSYGFELYRENSFNFAYSNIILKRFLFGICLKYHSISVKNYGNYHKFNVDLGCLFYLYPELRMGFNIANLLKEEEFPFSLIYNFGISYDVLQKASLNFSFQNEIELPISYRFGIDYNIVEFFSLRLGVQNQPNLYCGGFGIHYSYFDISYAFTSHQDLGFTHQFGLLFSFEQITDRYTRIRERFNLK